MTDVTIDISGSRDIVLVRLVSTHSLSNLEIYDTLYKLSNQFREIVKDESNRSDIPTEQNRTSSVESVQAASADVGAGNKE